jgi:D-alanyl-lipoteichoic acid acyltransferase DltB (MBOAT superfamily)
MGRKALAKPWPFAYLIAVPTFITMALAGIWHGAGLQFLIFGLLHAVYLTINHAWRTFGPKTGALVLGRLARGCLAVCQVLITYSAVLIAQAFFRAASVSDAVSILSAMLGAKGFEHPLSVPKLARSFLTPFAHRLIEDGAIDFHLSHDMQMQALMIPLAFVIVWLLPNSQQIMAGANPVLTKVETGGWRILTWRPTFRWAIAASGAAAIALMSIGGTHEFLYFQF